MRRETEEAGRRASARQYSSSCWPGDGLRPRRGAPAGIQCFRAAKFRSELQSFELFSARRESPPRPEFRTAARSWQRSWSGGDRGQESGGGRGGRFGRRGGRRRGGRPGGAPGGRNLPPSKYASPQGGGCGRQRGNDQRNQGSNRGPQPRGFEPRGGEKRGFEIAVRKSPAWRLCSERPSFDPAEEPILLPGESLAKYRGKPVGVFVCSGSGTAGSIDHPRSTENSGNLRVRRRRLNPALPDGGPRRFTGGLPRWLLADAGAESEAAPVSADENIGVADDVHTFRARK